MTKHYDVMVIDDEQVVLDAVNRICMAEDYTSDTNLEVTSALNKIRKNRYRLILCDLMLPEIDGFRFLDLLNEQGIDIPVIMTTGFSTMENAVKSLNKGAIEFIPKPFTSDELSSVITRGLKYAGLRQEYLESKKSGESVIYVPCPPRYFKLGYSTWISKEFRGVVLVGCTDLYLKTVGSVKDIIFKEAGEDIFQGSYCVDIVSDHEISYAIIAPMTGKILQTNPQLTEDHSLLEKDPYFQGWLYKIIPANYEYEIKNLVSCSVETTFG